MQPVFMRLVFLISLRVTGVSLSLHQILSSPSTSLSDSFTAFESFSKFSIPLAFEVLQLQKPCHQVSTTPVNYPPPPASDARPRIRSPTRDGASPYSEFSRLRLEFLCSGTSDECHQRRIRKTGGHGGWRDRLKHFHFH
jgi:hypothetical protein